MSHSPIYSERPRGRPDRQEGRGLIRLLAATSVLVAGMSLLTSLQYGTSDGAVVQVQHRIAYLNCSAARAVKLAPARIGQPGYWRHLDTDDDGISCELTDRR
ncbi:MULTISPECIES: excalibur calcium-binding domain-containing protein [Asticcacaulis]|uniref:excalibur calcium-binding domain-containing protein n=1 Tax=Asticcacaulis TaxID=76890 RepID=UPI001AEADBB5|nr:MULTISPECIES: excalibur calcium-binding domain-containing protein [Asticcacaulis]MBP2158014.1 hypothetical protein [Asticcacaulis solisilvae]MDR6799059.1 hypothetical protein [Asticcacaulis sp. BE141]